jgi:hypothetical protein
MMRTEAEIRREVEVHLRRRGLLLVDAGLWIVAVFILWEIMPVSSFGTTLNSLLAIFMLGWTAVVGLHVLRTIYVELRELLARRAIEREHQMYLLRDAYEKRKHDEAVAHLTDDGELIDFADIPSRRQNQEND